MELTHEQKRIVRRLKKGNNVRVTAVAGSGKTTSILGLVGAKMNILVLCYNNRLRAETQRRAEMTMDPESEYIFDVQTFHSFCYNVLDEPLATTDLGIIKINDRVDSVPGYFADKYDCLELEYDLIICDEAQDLNEIYYKFLLTLLRYTGAKLCLIGDPRQAIYQFNGSNEKYLLEAPKYFDREFIDLTLSQTFRLTEPIAEFINGMYTENVVDTMTPKIVSKKKSKLKPLVMHHEVNVKQIAKFIKGFPPGDVLVLMYSVKRLPFKSSVKLANELMNSDVPVSFGNLSDDNEDSVLMLSYHQSKGLERPIVIIMDFNSFYFDASGDSPETVPNLWYVAMSRASEYLVIHTEVPFKFINNGLMATGAKMSNTKEYSINDASSGGWTRRNKTFDDFLRYTPSTDIWNMIKAGQKYPKFTAPISGHRPLCVTQNSIIGTMITDYLRRSDRKMSAKTFVADYLTKIRGGIKYHINTGSAYYEGFSPLEHHRALDVAEITLNDVLKICGITTSSAKLDTFTDPAHNNIELIDTKTDTVIIITIDTKSMDTHVRWAGVTSATKKKCIIVDVLTARHSLFAKE